MLKSSFISTAIILILSGFIVRFMGFIYRIYLSNLIGSEGMGLFQLILPLYSMIILTLTSGISISVSKMVAGEMAKNQHTNAKKIMVCALKLILGTATLVSILLFIFIDFISSIILKDSRVYLSLVLLIPCIPVIVAASALKGYFYGIQNMAPTAVSQIIEQVVKIGFVMVAVNRFGDYRLEYACAIAVFGMALGEIANLAVLSLAYYLKKNKLKKNLYKDRLIKNSKIYRQLAAESLPISFNRFIASVLGAVETILIPKRMVAGGIAYHTSMMEFGKLTGMAMPLVFFPAVITSALATALVPAISESISVKNFTAANHRITKALQMTFVLGIIFTEIFYCYSTQICNVIYTRDKVGDILYLLSFTCIFLYLQQILTGILNGLGKQTASLCTSLIGTFIRIGFVYFCIPLYMIKGYVWGIIISSAIVCTLNIYLIRKETDLQIDLKNWFFKPIIVGIIMVICSKYIYSFFEIFKVGGFWIISMTLTANIAIAVELMVIAGVVDKKEILRLIGLAH